MDKEDVVHIYNVILFSHKKNKIINTICSSMDGPRNYHTNWKVSQTERDQISYDITYMWNLKYDTNEMKQSQTHRHRDQTCGFQAGAGGWRVMD